MSSSGNLQHFDFDDMGLDSPDATGQTIYADNTENPLGSEFPGQPALQLIA